MEKNEVLLRVDHLCQYFGPTKAVDDVSFDIYKGEVFGLVGESGCGKTTTGRSIIRLYDITSGNIYFKGVRIGAGIRNYQVAIAEAREKLKQCKDPGEIAKLKEIIKENQTNIRSAKKDKKHVDKKLVTQIQMIFQDPIASLDPRMTVMDTIAEGLVIRGEKDREVLEKKVYDILEKVGLVREHANRYPSV